VGAGDIGVVSEWNERVFPFFRHSIA
jgi:hypothetical protein